MGSRDYAAHYWLQSAMPRWSSAPFFALKSPWRSKAEQFDQGAGSDQGKWGIVREGVTAERQGGAVRDRWSLFALLKWEETPRDPVARRHKK